MKIFGDDIKAYRVVYYNPNLKGYYVIARFRYRVDAIMYCQAEITRSNMRWYILDINDKVVGSYKRDENV